MKKDKPLKRFNKNYICAIAYGIFGSLGFLCLVNFVLMTAIDFKAEMYPYSYPFCIIAGTASACICVATFLANLHFIGREEKKARTILKEIAVVAVTFIIVSFVWSGLWTLASSFIKYMGW